MHHFYFYKLHDKKSFFSPFKSKIDFRFLNLRSQYEKIILKSVFLLLKCQLLLIFPSYSIINILFSLAKIIFFFSFISISHGIVEKKPHSCFVRTIIVLNIFFLIVIALSIAVIYRFAAIIKESKYLC